jgi:site-specific recombinase XerC
MMTPSELSFSASRLLSSARMAQNTAVCAGLLNEAGGKDLDVTTVQCTFTLLKEMADRGLSKSSRRTYLASWKAALKAATGVSTNNHPTGPKPERRVKETLSFQEASRVIRWMIDNQEGHPAAAVAQLCLMYGLRPGEEATKEGAFVGTSRGLTVTGKGGHTRIIPHPDGFREGAGLKPVTSISYNTAARHWKTAVILSGAFRKGGFKDPPTLHSLRHCYATEAYRQLGDILQVRDLLGHSALTTTEIYVKAVPTKSISLGGSR